MSDSQFLLDYLPSFYKNFMIDKDGNNLLLPIFDIYCNSMADAIFQEQQIGMVPFLEQCDPIIIELFSTIDVTIDNQYNDGYIIDNEIIKVEDLYLDGNFTKSILGSFVIKYDISKHIKYIVFDIPVPLTQSNIFIKKVYRDKQILQNIWGNLLDYKRQIPDYNTLSDNDSVDYDSIKFNLNKYKNELLALLYVSINGPSFKILKNGLGIFIGLEYAPFDGVVIDISTGITIESLDRLKTYTANVNSRADLLIGSKVNKYDILQDLNFNFYDISSNPAIFTQILLSGSSQRLMDLLNIDEANGEKYAHLTFDSTISFDDDNIYWDEGDGTGLVKDLSGTTPIVGYDPFGTHLNRFDNWVSPLFENQKLYEMFRNLFIIEIDSTVYNNNNVDYFLNKVKPIWSKYLVFTYGGA